MLANRYGRPIRDCAECFPIPNILDFVSEREFQPQRTMDLSAGGMPACRRWLRLFGSFEFGIVA